MRLVATALPARDHATIIALDGRGHHAAVAPRADGHAAWTDTDGDVPVVAPATVVAIVTVAADPNIDALRHLELLGLGRNGAANQRGRHHYRPGRQGENDLQHVGLLPPGLLLDTQGNPYGKVPRPTGADDQWRRSVIPARTW